MLKIKHVVTTTKYEILNNETKDRISHHSTLKKALVP